MVTRLKKKKKDPNGLKRGPGFYYLRGGKRAGEFTLPSGFTVKGPYYSKYDKKRDAAKKSSGWRDDIIGVPTKLASKYAHISDGQLKKKILR